MKTSRILNLTPDQFNRRWHYMRFWFSKEERAKILKAVHGNTECTVNTTLQSDEGLYGK